MDKALVFGTKVAGSSPARVISHHALAMCFSNMNHVIASVFQDRHAFRKIYRNHEAIDKSTLMLEPVFSVEGNSLQA